MKALLRRVLPETIRRRLARARDGFRLNLHAICARSSVLGWLAYAVSPHFFSDFRGFLSGVRLYNLRRGSHMPNISLLRRNIHRIEKGVCHPARRSSFATSYILETVLIFDQLRKRPEIPNRSELAWGQLVLAKYFEVTDDTDQEYLEARSVFEQVTEPALDIRLEDDTLQYRNRSQPGDNERFLNLLRQRKSVRKYADEPVPEEVIATALEAASLAPSSCNRQPYRYYVMRDAETAQRAAAISAGTAGWVHEIRCLAVVVGDTSYFSNAVNRHSIYVDATLSVMPFVLSLEAQGFSTGLINWADDRPRREKMAKILGLKPYQRVIISIAIGRADILARAPISMRKHTGEISEDVN